MEDLNEICHKLPTYETHVLSFSESNVSLKQLRVYAAYKPDPRLSKHQVAFQWYVKGSLNYKHFRQCNIL